MATGFFRIDVKRAGLLALVLAALAWTLPAPSAMAAKKCSKEASQPDSGTLTLQYLRPSDRQKNKDRNDYRLSGTLRWNSQDAIKCFDNDTLDWAYEHNINYQAHFDRKIWNEDLSSFPSDSHPYIDNTPRVGNSAY